MHTLSSQNDHDLQGIENPMVSRSGKTSNSILPYYHLLSPFQLTFITFHPEDLENYFFITSLAPDFMTYSALEKNEIERYLTAKTHQHNFYELLFVLEGTLFQKIENQRHLYTPGSCCLLNRNVKHTEEYSTDFRAIFLEMSEEFLQEIFASLSLSYFEVEKEHKTTQLEEFLSQNIYNSQNYDKNYIDLIPVQDSTWITQNVHNLFEQMTFEILNPHFGSSFLIKGLFFKLLHILSDPVNYETTPVKIGTMAENFIFNKISELMSNTNGRITRSELSHTLNYSGVYLNNITKKYTGLSIFEYGMTFCMKKAIELLLDTSISISEAALELGFSNRSHFYKIFQETYHITPAEYRKKYSTDKHL